MTLADCDRVSEIRVRGWQSAYQGLMPQSFLDALSVPKDAEWRRAHFSARAKHGVVNLVAEQDGEIVGWAAYGPYRDGEPRTEEAESAELYAIYVDPDRYGGGVGHALLQESLRRCEAAGHGSVLLWVLKGNAHARRFYDRAGFRADGIEEPFDVEGVAVPEVRYAKRLSR
jgi:GNAT superfamily N-acetyltransferase